MHDFLLFPLTSEFNGDYLTFIGKKKRKGRRGGGVLSQTSTVQERIFFTDNIAHYGYSDSFYNILYVSTNICTSISNTNIILSTVIVINPCTYMYIMLVVPYSIHTYTHTYSMQVQHCAMTSQATQSKGLLFLEEGGGGGKGTLASSSSSSSSIRGFSLFDLGNRHSLAHWYRIRNPKKETHRIRGRLHDMCKKQ